MKRQSILGFSVVLLLAGAVQANNACRSDSSDRYSAGVLMPAGPHKGQCIDTTQKRAPMLLSKNSKELRIANFRYQGKFWNASIPVNAIESMEFVFVDLNVEQLSSLGIHVFHNHLRFRFKKSNPILLESQFAPKGARRTAVHDVIVSMNYMAPKGVEYNPAKGFDSKEYLSVLQIYATKDEAQIRFVEQKLNVFTVKLNINPAQSWKVFLGAVERSHKEGYSVPYDTWDSNCALAAFDLLDSALRPDYGRRVKPFKMRIWQIRDTSFMPALDALKERGLLTDDRGVRLMNSEFGYRRYSSRWNRY